MKRLIKHSRRNIYRSLSAIYDRPLGPLTEREKKLVEELKVAFRKIPSLEPTNCSLSMRQWSGNVSRLMELVLNDDPREFLRWDVILRTMSVTYAGYITAELKYLKRRSDWGSRWCEAIKEAPVGHPVPHWRYPGSSANLIHHAYHLAQFEEKSMLRSDAINYIFEFGGGYGSMCRLLYNLGFQGKYVLFDLPAFSLLQEFFLKSIGVEVCSADSFKTTKSGVVCISDMQGLKGILSSEVSANDSMFIATWSISETPTELRNSILSLVSSFKAFLIAYQGRFGEVNNIELFRNWTATQKGIDWYDWEIKHLPNNRYLIGKRTAT